MESTTNNDANPLAEHAKLRDNWAAVKRGQVFNSLNSKPEEWAYEGGCVHVVDEVQCQLCETMINYQFPLKRGETLLMIGRECVTNFYVAYFPNGLDVVLDMMDASFKATRKGVIAQKIEEFRKANPKLVEFLLDSSDSRKKEFRSVIVTDPDGMVRRISTAKFRAALKRRGYLHPKEVLDLMVNVERWVFYAPALGRLG